MWTHSTFCCRKMSVRLSMQPLPGLLKGEIPACSKQMITHLYATGSERQPVGKEKIMPAYAVLRIQKLKSWGDIAGSDAHNYRERETPNADAERTPDNSTFAGDPAQDSVEAIKSAIGNQNIRKNAVLAVEMLLSASPEHFIPDDKSKAGSYDLSRAWEWAETSAQWLRERYGNRVIKAVMHLDEATPHMHATIVPLDDKGKLNCRALFGGTRHTLTDLQTDYAKAVEKLGIERGLQGSQAKHQDVAKFYALTQNQDHPALPRAKAVDIPPLPGRVERLSDSVLTRFAQEVAASAIDAQQSKAVPALQMLTGENAMLKKQTDDLRRSNAALNQERDRLKREADQLRGLPLPEVLTQLYGACEASDSKASYKSRKFELPDGTKIGVTDDLWHDNTNNVGKKGAINLVMHLSGYGQEQYKQAVRDLADAFGSGAANRAVSRHIIDTAPKQAERITLESIREPAQLPQPCPETWQRVRDYLTKERKLPGKIIDAAHSQGLVYSDQRANCVFPCDKESGAFLRGSGKQPFKRTMGQGHLPYSLKGSDNKVFVAESAIDALSLKVIHPASAVIATGGNMPPERLKPYLEGKEVYLAHDADKAGEAQATRIQQQYPEAKRLCPPRGKDWNEFLQKKQEREIQPERQRQVDMER